MHATTARTARFLVVMTALLGLTFTLAPAPTAEASPRYVKICNSPGSTPGAKLWVFNKVFRNGLAVFPGGCRLVRRDGLKVNPEGTCWQVRSMPWGEYGRNWVSMWSYPGKKDGYTYRTGC